MADAGAGEGILPAAQHLQRRALSGRWARPCSAAAARRAMMRSPGAMRAALRRAASTSSRIARSPASARAPNGAVIGVETDARLHRRQEGRRRRRPAIPRSIMNMAGVRMPLESYPLQALVSEPVKPIFPCVVMSNTVHAYISQSDKGELVIGAGTDQYVSYSQTGGLQIIAAHARRDLRDVPDVHAHEDAALLGRHRRRHAGPLADPGQDAGAGPLRQLRLGHGRLQGDAGLGPRLRPYHRHATSRTRSTRPSRSTASAPAA